MRQSSRCVSPNEQRDAQRLMDTQQLGIQFQRLFQRRNSLFVISHLEVRDSEIRVSRGHFGRSSDHLFKFFDCLVEMTLLLRFHAGLSMLDCFRRHGLGKKNVNA